MDTQIRPNRTQQDPTGPINTRGFRPGLGKNLEIQVWVGFGQAGQTLGIIGMIPVQSKTTPNKYIDD